MDVQTSAILIPPPPAEMPWQVVELAFHEGQSVRQGQVLAQLRAVEDQQALTSPQDGYVIGLHAVTGQTVSTGQVLCCICAQPPVKTAQSEAGAARSAFDPTALLIFGGGGHGKAVIDLVRALGTYQIVGIIDDGIAAGSEILGVPVVGGASTLPDWYARGVRLAANAVGGIGNVDVRLKIFDILIQAGFSFPALAHPSAIIERSATLAAGVQVLPQAYVGSAAQVGFGTVLNAGATVSHDCVLGQVVNLSPGATLAGNVHIEDDTQIGMCATVNLGITVGSRCIVGNGATVKADVPPGTRVWAGTVWPIRKPKPEATGSTL